MEKSKFASLGEILGSMWLQRHREESEVTVCKRRKKGSELGAKMMSFNGKQVLDYVSGEICYDREDPAIYLATAIKLNSPENRGSLDSISKSIFESSHSETNKEHNNVVSDDRIIQCLMSVYCVLCQCQKEGIRKITNLFRCHQYCPKLALTLMKLPT